ncbi:uncharacterized protein LOC120083223 [Benincasa hispida]|uniref:uncharacterized protein LOC120083223 n=1 Tax=Benincasa hispida TaxID=102211 RepID=UPI0019028D6B|nr:uncharacterized protein LOC120083223 [Benincasa hispida]XP_038894812.1 uncharacterized protein LOC120083223 [Benincasa hispida]
MEERKLNFNAPLMSVRRFSKAASSLAKVNEKKSENSHFSRRSTFPVSRPQFNLDQVTEPVAVPFHWEQIPGRAKNDSGSASPEVQLPHPPERTCSTPRLSFNKYSLEMEACHQDECEASSSSAIVVRLESTKARDARSLASENDDNDDDDDDDDDFSDARETLSLTGSFSVNNCSVSGISGCNGPMVKPSGTFRTDPQTRDFMMSRFLPAAKAMVLEPAKYSLKKKLVAVEQPRHVKKVMSENRRTSPIKQLESTLLLQYGEDEVHGVDEVDEESDSVDDEYDNSGNISARGCGLIPNICFKNSLGLLNPVPGMRIRTDASVSLNNKVGGSSRTMHHSHSQKINKHAWDAAYKQKSEAAVGSPKLPEVKDKWTGESKHFPSSTDVQMRGRSSPFRYSRAASPFRSEASRPTCRKQPVVVPKEVDIISRSKGDIDFHDTPSIRATKHGVDMASTLIEKILYIDTASVAETNSPFNSTHLDDEKKSDRSSGKNETAFEARVMEESTTVEPSFLEIKCLTLVEEGRLEREAAESKMKDAIDDGPNVGHELYIEDHAGYANLGTADEEDYSKANYQLVKVEDPANAIVTSVISSQPPPLPKSPSESWLWRTLPSVSSKKLLAGSNLGSKFYQKPQSPRTSASTKWETIVKSSNLHHDHVRYSEELIPRVSQHSTTENFK